MCSRQNKSANITQSMSAQKCKNNKEHHSLKVTQGQPKSRKLVRVTLHNNHTSRSSVSKQELFWKVPLKVQSGVFFGHRRIFRIAPTDTFLSTSRPIRTQVKEQVKKQVNRSRWFLLHAPQLVS